MHLIFSNIRIAEIETTLVRLDTQVKQGRSKRPCMKNYDDLYRHGLRLYISVSYALKEDSRVSNKRIQIESRSITYNEAVDEPQQVGFSEAISQVLVLAQQKDDLLKEETNRRNELEEEVATLKNQVIIYEKNAEANSINATWKQIVNQYMKSWKYLPVIMAIPMVIYVFNRK